MPRKLSPDRMAFLKEVREQAKQTTVAEACRRWKLSRSTYYKLLADLRRGPKKAIVSSPRYPLTEVERQHVLQVYEAMDGASLETVARVVSKVMGRPVSKATVARCRSVKPFRCEPPRYWDLEYLKQVLEDPNYPEDVTPKRGRPRK